MTDEEYVETQNKIVLLAQFAKDLDLNGFLERIAFAETLGPIIHPTLYKQGMKNLGQIKRLAQSLMPFHKEIWQQINGEGKGKR